MKDETFWKDMGIWGLIMVLSFFTVLGIGTFVEWLFK